MLQHKHLIVRADILNPPGPNDIGIMANWFSNLIDAMNMKIMMGPILEYSHMVGNRGFTGACIIETSHVVAHVWDEDSPGMLQLDVYTCGCLDLDVIFGFIDHFKPTQISYKFLDREHDLITLDEGIRKCA